jgi:C1A family cysteine protease
MKKFYWISCAIMISIASFLVFNSCEKQKDDSTRSIVQNSDGSDSGEKGMGFVPLPKEDYKAIAMAQPVYLKSVAAVVNLECPPIGNQGGEGSCVAWGSTYAGRSIARKMHDGGTYAKATNIFSPEYVYNQIKISNCSSGAYIYKAFDLLKSQGVCTWNDMPYSSTNGCSTKPNTTQKQKAAANKIISYARVDITVSAIKNVLGQNKPVVIGGPVDQTYYDLGSNQVLTNYNSATYLGGHCVCIVGYDDTKQAFKFQNSWGTSWGTSGFGWMGYNAISGYITEAYVMTEN